MKMVNKCDLCTDFKSQSRKTWNKLKQAQGISFRFLEESITDFNLFELQQKHPMEIETHKLTRNEETMQGADWEWWFTAPGLRLGFRVQAKMLKTQTLRYEKLDYKTPSGDRQIDLLIKQAINGHHGPTLPLYVLYNFWDKTKHYPNWQCPTSRKDIRLFGCGIVEARALKAILDSKGKKLEDISNSMYPWSCLVCCRGHTQDIVDPPLPIRAFDFVSKIYGEKGHFQAKREEFVVKQGPWYVENILQGEGMNADVEGMLAQSGLRGITVIKELRESNALIKKG